MRFPTLFACAAALLLISAGASHAAAPAITGEMQKKYESMQSFTAEFTQRLVHQESGSEETRQGTLAFQKPLRVRWETKAPHAELLVITDKDVWDYLPDEELAYQYSPEVVHDSRSIIQVITGQSRLDKDFTVEAEPDDNGLAVLRLYPKDPSPQLVEALLWVDKGRCGKTVDAFRIRHSFSGDHHAFPDPFCLRRGPAADQRGRFARGGSRHYGRDAEKI